MAVVRGNTELLTQFISATATCWISAFRTIVCRPNGEELSLWIVKNMAMSARWEHWAVNSVYICHNGLLNICIYFLVYVDRIVMRLAFIWIIFVLWHLRFRRLWEHWTVNSVYICHSYLSNICISNYRYVDRVVKTCPFNLMFEELYILCCYAGHQVNILSVFVLFV